MESAYQRQEKKEKSMCKHCKSTAHSSLQHGKHYKGFKEEMKEKRMEKHMKMFTRAEDEAQDKKAGRKQGSKEDLKLDNARGLGYTHKKGFPRAPKGPHGRAAVHALGRTKTTGNFAKIEAESGKGAAINAYQAALRKHQGKA